MRWPLKDDCNVIRTHSHLNYKRTLHRLGSNLLGSNPVLVTKTSDIAPVSSKEFLDIQATTECRFILKRICDMIGTHSCTIFFVKQKIF